MRKLVSMRPLAVGIATCLVVPLLVGSCEQAKQAAEGASDICCTDFKVGADFSGVDFGVDASIAGKYKAFLQAAADLSATATVSLSDVTAACRDIAVGMGANAADPSVQGASGAAAATAWCGLAKAQIDAKFGASGSLGGQVAVAMTPPKCEASFEAKAKCEASCSGTAECDFNVNPPTCEGGTLSVECSGSCSGEANASIECTGSCTGNCKGSCSATGGVAVACNGSCDGTCAAGGGAGETGIQADGTCKGTCDGTCTADATAPAVQCSGVCEGTCDAACQATGTVKARCSGKCDSAISAPKCKGGTMGGGCTVDVDCSGSCSGSASAKANCTPPEIGIAVTAKAGVALTAEQEAEVAIALETLRVNLPKLLLVFKGRAQAFTSAIESVISIGGSLIGEGNAGKIGVKGMACGGIAALSIGDALTNFTAAFNASANVAGSFMLQ
ncbi:MAG: hypothetical protein JW940_27830 [Polyangiaceae bacterium]|nr:hypothetical protein [Polyangiaceae bacterium]